VAPWALTMLRLRREVQPALREAHGSFIADKISVPELPLDGMRIVSFERHGAPAKPPVLSERLPDWKRPTAAPRCARILFPDLPGPWDDQPQSFARELASHDSEKIDLPAVTPTRCAHPRLLAFVLGLSPSSTLLPG
jgi:hypothetical protein